jgi:hypothetical protein
MEFSLDKFRQTLQRSYRGGERAFWLSVIRELDMVICQNQDHSNTKIALFEKHNGKNWVLRISNELGRIAIRDNDTYNRMVSLCCRVLGYKGILFATNLPEVQNHHVIAVQIAGESGSNCVIILWKFGVSPASNFDVYRIEDMLRSIKREIGYFFRRRNKARREIARIKRERRRRLFGPNG